MRKNCKNNYVHTKNTMFFRYFYYFLKIFFKKEFKNGKKHRVFRVEYIFGGIFMEKEKVLEALMESIKMAMNGNCDIRVTIRNGDIEVLYALGKEAETDECENTETVSSGTEKEGD